MLRYTKADLEAIVLIQLENLDAVSELVRLMKVQNDLIHKAHKSLETEITRFERKQFDLAQRKKIKAPN